MDYIYDFSDPAADLAAVGGKGASLTRMVRAGLPVPPGFHVSVAAYRSFVEANGLGERIEKALAGVDLDAPAAIEAAASGIRAALLAAPIPADVEAAIRAAVARFGAARAAAVRSSATAEDLPGLSFAGQQESFLDLSGEDAILGAVKRCWASLWNGRAVSYRAKRGYEDGALAIAVVVQALADADAAGILFTAHPVTGRRSVCLVDAAFGLGEAVVGGEVSPDSYLVDKATGGLLERRVADKALRTVRRPGGGTANVPNPPELRSAPVLADAEAAALAALGSRAEALFGAPVDVEWAREGGGFVLLQARPITALPAEEPEPPREWPLPDPKGRYVRGSIVDFAPAPLSPLYATMGLRIYEETFAAFIAELTGRRDPLRGARYTALINGYLYVAMSFPPSYFLAVLGALPEILRRMRRTGDYLAAAIAEYESEVARLAIADPGRASAAELLASAAGLTAAATRYLAQFQTGPAGAGASEMLLSKAWERGIRAEGEPPASALLLGFESAASKADDAWADIISAAAADPELAAPLAAADPRAISAALARGEAPRGIPRDAWERLAASIRDYASAHRRSVYDLDFAVPAPAEDYAPLAASIAGALGQPSRAGADPRARRAAAAAARDELAARALSRLRWPRKALFRFYLRWAQRAAPLREDGIAALGLAYPALRRALLELGSRLASRGALSDPVDVFWLEEGELRDAASALDSGRAVPADARAAAAARKALDRSRRRSKPPHVLPHAEKLMGFKLADFFPGETGGETPGLLRGTGASGGAASGPARILRGPADFASMRKGDILVAEITTPAWTPLFALASAVVTDIGGPLSHGSIVAREYGIPAVLGCASATRRLRDGDLVRVDGDSGTVAWDEAR